MNTLLSSKTLFLLLKKSKKSKPIAKPEVAPKKTIEKAPIAKKGKEVKKAVKTVKKSEESRQITDDGLKIFTEDELKIG